MSDQPSDQPSGYLRSDRQIVLRQDLGVVFKVMGLSSAIALWIKYVMPAFPIPASSSIALLFILLPSAIVALILILKLRIEN
jgi:hypothetical protein